MTTPGGGRPGINGEILKALFVPPPPLEDQREIVRLPDDQTAAIACAEVLNADVDAWRRGEAVPSAPTGVKTRAKGPAPGTVAALIAGCKASRWWSKLAPATTRSYEWALDAIEA